MSNKWKGSRVDGRRSGFTLSVTSSAPDALAANARARFERRWKDVEDAMLEAGRASVRFGKSAIRSRRTRRTGKLEDRFKFKLTRHKGRKATLEVGWLDWTGKPYYDWQERGTMSKRVAGVGGKRMLGPVRGWKPNGTGRGEGIDPMLVLPDARKVMHETFRSELRL